MWIVEVWIDQRWVAVLISVVKIQKVECDWNISNFHFSRIPASEMVRKLLEGKSALRTTILHQFVNGQDLDDQLVLDLLCEAVGSPAARDRGYILDGMPTHSEMKMSIPDQLQLIRNLPNGPDYIIEIQVSSIILYPPSLFRETVL